MLNVNAKAFVPPGASDSALQSINETGLYRYKINVPRERKADISNDALHLNSVASLISFKHLFWIRGGADEEALRVFLNECFLSATNLPTPSAQDTPNSGFLLSRALLSFNADVNAVIALNDAPGLLIRLDFPKECGADVSSALGSAWEAFYDTIKQDSRVSSFGYGCSLTGSNGSRTGGAYRHYFHTACIKLDPHSDTFPASALANCPAPIASIIPVNSVVPFISGMRSPLSVMITVGERAGKAYSKGTLADYSFKLNYFPHDADRTFANLDSYKEFFLGLLQGDCKWERTYIINLHVTLLQAKGEVTIPIWDVIQYAGSLCDSASANIIGVSFSATDVAPGSKELLLLNSKGPFYVNASLDEALEKNNFLDTANTVYGGTTQVFKRELSTLTRGAALKAIRYFFSEKNVKKHTAKMLTRMAFEDAAQQFAKKRFSVRRKVMGSPILVGTDVNGEAFGVDIETSSIFGLPSCFGGVVGAVQESVFKGTLTSSFRGYQEYRIIIHDVLVFQGSDVLDLPFSKRWRYVEGLCLDDEDNWPHGTHDHITTLKAEYVPFEKTEGLLSAAPCDHDTMGLCFVPNDQANGIAERESYVWVPPVSLTVLFRADRVENNPEGESDLRRVFFAVEHDCDAGIYIPYEGEYADFQADAYPDVAIGTVLECILRRADDGAHWWDVLRDFDEGMRKVSTFEEVSTLVHSPGITQKEMLWLVTASSFECGRCHKVDDVGARNTRHNSYWCRNCWRETGHGDCTYCNRSCALGMLDANTQLFYCENCWNKFSQTNSQAEIGYHVPPPPNATFTQQVTTRCISLLVDIMNPKCPSNDVLDLCCGGSVMRKWMRNRTARYIGIDLKASVVGALVETVANSADELPANAHYDVVCADAFSADFWTHTITTVHPRQFHVITCFAGMHHVFKSEESARHFVGSVANALVPGGVFLGIIVDASVLYAKGRKYSTPIMKAEWGEGAVPRIGHSFKLSTENGLMRETHVIPIDFLIAVAGEFGLHVVPEGCRTFRELIEKDPNYTVVPNADEKEYLCAITTLALKKQAAEQAPVVVGM